MVNSRIRGSFRLWRETPTGSGAKTLRMPADLTVRIDWSAICGRSFPIQIANAHRRQACDGLRTRCCCRIPAIWQAFDLKKAWTPAASIAVTGSSD